MKTPRLKSAGLLLVGLMLFFAGCVETAMMFRGNLLNPSQQVQAIDDGVVSRETLESFETVIRYEYLRKGDILAISGQASLTERYPMLYSTLRYLDIYLFFTDSGQRVLETVLLANAMTRVDEVATFSRELKIPKGAVGVAFGYSGEVTGGGDERDDGREIFYLLPLKR